MRLNNKGFTLVELIIVIAIIAVLSVVIAPQYLKFVEQARESKDLQVAQNLMEASTLAIIDPDNDIPAGYYVEVLWATSDNNRAEDMGIVLFRCSSGRVSVFNDKTGDDDMTPLPSNGDALKMIADSVLTTIGLEEGKSSIHSGYEAFLYDAESVIGNTVNFAFHLNTTTGEIALARLSSDGYVNNWLELGINATPAP